MILLVALLLQATSLFLLRQQLFGTWLQRPFALTVIAATLYHGVSEVLMLIPSVLEFNKYREGVDQLHTHLAALFISGGILAATLVYLVALRDRGRHARADTSRLDDALRVLDWKYLLVALVPLAAATYAGGGYASGQALDSRSQGLLQVLASQLFLVVFILTTYSFVARRRGRLVLPALAVQSVLMAAAGQRLEVLVSAIAVCVLLTISGYEPRSRQLVAAGVVGVLLVLAIGTVRATAGREVFYSNTGIAERVETVTASLLRGGVQASLGDSYLAEAAVRLDSNELTGYVLQGIDSGDAPLGWGAAVRTLEVAIPSALNPDKLSQNGADLSAKGLVRDHFGRSSMDTLPGHFGLYAGFVGPWGALVVAGMIGLGFALAERRLFTRLTAAKLIWLCLFIVGALFYEKSVPQLLSLLRYGLPLGLAAAAAQYYLPKLSAPTGMRKSLARQVAGKP